MRVRRIIICCFLLMFPYAFSAYGTDDTVTIGTYDFAPLCNANDPKATPTGPHEEYLFITLIEQTAAIEGWQIRYVPGSYSEGLSLLKQGKIDLLAAAAYTKSSESEFDFTRETVISTWAQIFIADNSDANSIIDLAGKTIGLMRDDPYNNEIRSLIKRFNLACHFIEFNSYPDVFMALEQKWIDAGVVDRLYAGINENKYSLERTSIILSPVELRFAALKDNNKELISAFDYHLAAWKNEPASVYNQSLYRILGTAAEFRIPIIVKLIVFISIGLFFMACGISYLLKKRIQARTLELSNKNEELKIEVINRQSIETTLKNTNKLLETTFSSMHDGLCIVDPQTREILSCNNAAAGILGCNLNELQGTPFDAKFPESNRFSTFRDLIDLSFSTTGFLKEEFELGRKDSSLVPVEISVTAGAWAKSGKNNWIIIIRDISERKQAEKDKKQLTEQVHQLQKLEAIGQLAGGVAHDFNNMLAGISGYAELIKRNLNPPSPKLGRYADIILEATKRTGEVISKLLAFARKGKYEMKIVDIHEVIRNTINLLKHSIDKKIQIVQYLQAEPATVWGDPAQLQNAVLNIAVNARDAMPDGGKLFFKTENRELEQNYINAQTYQINPGVYLMLTITDTGIGMDSKTKARVFEPFFSTKAAGKGTGLGLPSVYGTVKSHEGSIEFESEPGKGTSFRILLPVIKTLQEPDQKQQEILEGSGTVLVIDDEEIARSSTMDLLSNLGYMVFGCEDGPQAIEYYRNNNTAIDIVILDMIMPRMNGYDCFIELKKINPEIRVIISSGYALNDQAQKIMEEGALAFLQKPVSIHVLSKTVKKAFRCPVQDPCDITVKNSHILI